MVNLIKDVHYRQRKNAVSDYIELLGQGRKLVANADLTLEDFLAILVDKNWGQERSNKIVVLQQKLKVQLEGKKCLGEEDTERVELTSKPKETKRCSLFDCVKQ